MGILVSNKAKFISIAVATVNPEFSGLTQLGAKKDTYLPAGQAGKNSGFHV